MRNYTLNISVYLSYENVHYQSMHIWFANLFMLGFNKPQKLALEPVKYSP